MEKCLIEAPEIDSFEVPSRGSPFPEPPRSASADNIAYAATFGGDFGTLDLDTGVYSNIGSSGLPVGPIFGMGFIGNTLYGADNSNPSAGFYSIDPSTGLATSINPSMGSSVVGGTTGFGSFYSVTQDNPATAIRSDMAATSWPRFR